MEITYEPFKSRPLSDFYEELQFEFPNLPTQLFDYYLVRTARTMAKQANLIRRKAIIHGRQGVTRYRLEAPDGMDIVGILDIRYSPDCGCGVYEVTRSFVAPEGSYPCGRDIAWYDDQEKILHVSPSYCHQTYYVTIAVAPTPGDCTLPEQFFTDFLETLVLGVKGSLMLISGRPWTNLQLGQAYYNEFSKALASDGIDVSTHKQRSSIKIQFGRVM